MAVLRPPSSQANSLADQSVGSSGSLSPVHAQSSLDASLELEFRGARVLSGITPELWDRKERDRVVGGGGRW
jgi:hypothetical protein